MVEVISKFGQRASIFILRNFVRLIFKRFSFSTQTFNDSSHRLTSFAHFLFFRITKNTSYYEFLYFKLSTKKVVNLSCMEIFTIIGYFLISSSFKHFSSKMKLTFDFLLKEGNYREKIKYSDNILAYYLMVSHNLMMLIGSDTHLKLEKVEFINWYLHSCGF